LNNFFLNVFLKNHGHTIELANEIWEGIQLLTLRGKRFGGGGGIWPARDPKGAQYERNFLSGSSAKSFTPDTADMSLNPENRQDGNIKKEFYF